jgi:hypothetical protein
MGYRIFDEIAENDYNLNELEDLKLYVIQLINQKKKEEKEFKKKMGEIKRKWGK